MEPQPCYKQKIHNLSCHNEAQFVTWTISTPTSYLHTSASGKLTSQLNTASVVGTTTTKHRYMVEHTCYVTVFICRSRATDFSLLLRQL